MREHTIGTSTVITRRDLDEGLPGDLDKRADIPGCCDEVRDLLEALAARESVPGLDGEPELPRARYGAALERLDGATPAQRDEVDRLLGQLGELPRRQAAEAPWFEQVMQLLSEESIGR